MNDKYEVSFEVEASDGAEWQDSVVYGDVKLLQTKSGSIRIPKNATVKNVTPKPYPDGFYMVTHQGEHILHRKVTGEYGASWQRWEPIGWTASDVIAAWTEHDRHVIALTDEAWPESALDEPVSVPIGAVYRPTPENQYVGYVWVKTRAGWKALDAYDGTVAEHSVIDDEDWRSPDARYEAL